MRGIPPDKYFVLSNGEKIRSLDELVKSLSKLDDVIFYSHVTANKNDFSNWIRDVIGNKKLAEEISNMKDKKKMLRKIEESLHTHKKKWKIETKQKAEEKKIEKKVTKKEPKKAKAVKKAKPELSRKKTKQSKPQKKEADEDEKIDEHEAEMIIAEAEAHPKATDDSFEIEVDTKKPKKSIFHFLNLKKSKKDLTVDEFKQKLDDVFIKEKELMIRENKIQEIEERIEKKLDEHYGQKKFFAKEFFQGVLVGILLSMILILVYIQIVMK